MTFSNICADCGFVANHLTMLKRYGQKSKQASFSVSTTHIAICDVCGQEKDCTEPRDFFHPTDRAFRYVKRYVTTGKDQP
jgi:hypothetical protein